jgi:hypothetical protein
MLADIWRIKPYTIREKLLPEVENYCTENSKNSREVAEF